MVIGDFSELITFFMHLVNKYVGQGRGLIGV